SACQSPVNAVPSILSLLPRCDTKSVDCSAACKHVPPTNSKPAIPAISFLILIFILLVGASHPFWAIALTLHFLTQFIPLRLESQRLPLEHGSIGFDGGHN